MYQNSWKINRCEPCNRVDSYNENFEKYGFNFACRYNDLWLPVAFSLFYVRYFAL